MPKEIIFRFLNEINKSKEKNKMKKLNGITVAMITPFDDNDRVDVQMVQNLTEMLIAKGVDCLYPCGTTGEMLRMTVEERKLVAETVVKTAAGRVTLFIKVGCMRQDDTITLAQHAKQIGADGIGVVTPQFFGLNDREMEEYYVAVAQSVPGFPVYLYNIPQCASNDIKPDIVKRILARTDNVIGIKYSFADMVRTVEYINSAKGFSVLHGCDKLLVSLLDMGCDGTVSGCACAFPEPFVACMAAYRDGKMEEARAWNRVCVRFVDALRAGSNMSFFKEALTARGLCGGKMRAPQLDLTDEERDGMISELKTICEESGISFSL
ncbi:MAG: dihydrodipicolinate synthase family protein [Lachnospiraceae bacterium]|nr:dihydrodipicolinate synthase family protein [Lachnospiraceae bacterium]